MAVAVRAVSYGYVNNSGTITVALPAGTTAGDTLVIFGCHGYQVNTPSGFDQSLWTNIGNFNGAAFVKIVATAADVTAGSVTVTFTGGYYGHVVIIALTGAIIGISAKVMGSSSSGAASRTVTTPATGKAGDYVLYFGAGRVNTAISSTGGATALASDSQANSSFVLKGENLAADGSATSTFSYPTFGSGDFQAILMVSELVGPAANEYEIAAEVLKGAQADAQLFDISAETLRAGNSNAQVFEVYAEVLRSVTVVLRRRPVVIKCEVIADAGVNYAANTLFVDGSPLMIDTDTVEF